MTFLLCGSLCFSVELCVTKKKVKNLHRGNPEDHRETQRSPLIKSDYLSKLIEFSTNNLITFELWN